MQLITALVTLAVGSVAVSAATSQNGLKAREFGDKLSARQFPGGSPSSMMAAPPSGRGFGAGGIGAGGFGGGGIGGGAIAGGSSFSQTSITTQSVYSTFTTLQSTFVSAQSYISSCTSYMQAVSYLQTMYQQYISPFDFSFQGCSCQGFAQNGQYVSLIQSTLSVFYQIVQIIQQRWPSQLSYFSSVTTLFQSWMQQTYSFTSTYQIASTVFQNAPINLLQTTGFGSSGFLSSIGGLSSLGGSGGLTSLASSGGVTKAAGGLLGNSLL